MRVLLLKGLFGEIFSRGLYDLADKLEDVDSMSDIEVKSYLAWRRFKNEPIDILIGHSLGAVRCMKLAEALETYGHKPKLVALIDYVVNPYNIKLPNCPVVNFITDDIRARKIDGAENIPVEMSHIEADDSKLIHNLIIQRIEALNG